MNTANLAQEYKFMSGLRQYHAWSRTLLLSGFLLPLLFSPASVQTLDLDALVERSTALARAGLHDESLRAVEELVSAAKTRYGEPRLPHASALVRKGNLLLQFARPDDAGAAFEQALLNYRAISGKTSAVATVLNNLGLQRHWIGRHDEAVRYYREALELAETAAQRDDLVIADSLNNLGHVCRYLGRNSEAVPLLERALKLRESRLEPTGPSIGQILQNLASARESQGDYVAAEKDLRRAHAIYAKALERDHPLTTSVLNRLGINMFLQNRTKDAEASFREACPSSGALRQFEVLAKGGSGSVAVSG